MSWISYISYIKTGLFLLDAQSKRGGGDYRETAFQKPDLKRYQYGMSAVVEIVV